MKIQTMKSFSFFFLFFFLHIHIFKRTTSKTKIVFKVLRENCLNEGIDMVTNIHPQMCHIAPPVVLKGEVE